MLSLLAGLGVPLGPREKNNLPGPMIYSARDAPGPMIIDTKNRGKGGSFSWRSSYVQNLN